MGLRLKEAASPLGAEATPTDSRGLRDGSDVGEAERRYMAWFHELDAWTEYWDIYHPETHGRFYFGDGARERHGIGGSIGWPGRGGLQSITGTDLLYESFRAAV